MGAEFPMPSLLPVRWQTLSNRSVTWWRGTWPRRVAVAIAVLAAALFLFRDPILGPAVDAYPVIRSDLVQTVVSSGRIMTPQRMAVASVITASVARIPVEEGQRVKSGDVLIVLDDRDTRAALAQAQAAVVQAEAKLRQLREVALPAAEQGHVQAQANLVLARQQFERSQNLLAKGFISQSALDDAKRNLDVAESQLRAARLQVDTNGRQAAIHDRAGRAAQANANVAMRRRGSIRPLSARRRRHADRTRCRAGAVAQPGKELMVLAPSTARPRWSRRSTRRISRN